MLTRHRARLTSVLALPLIAVLTLSCSEWTYVPHQGVDYEKTLPNQHVLFTERDGTRDLIVQEVRYPFARGRPYSPPDGPVVDVDLREVVMFQIYHAEYPGSPVRTTNYDAMVNKQVRFHEDGKVTELAVKELAYPMVRGPRSSDPKKAAQEVDLRNISGYEIKESDLGSTDYKIFGALFLLFVVVPVYIAASL